MGSLFGSAAGWVWMGGGQSRGGGGQRRLARSCRLWLLLLFGRECVACWSCFPLSQRASECLARKVNGLDKQTGNHWKWNWGAGTRRRRVETGNRTGKKNKEAEKEVAQLDDGRQKLGEEREDTQISQADCWRAASS